MLEASWRETAVRAGVAAPDVETIFQDLYRCYSAPQRAYHNLDHVAAMLNIVSSFEEGLYDPVAVRLAIWFHDVVYDPRRNDNEDQSAAHMMTMLKGGVWNFTRMRVLVLISKTKTHMALPNDTDCQFLLDADLAILGASAEEYDRYAQAIREEYAWVPEADYRAGRQKVLTNFLERPRLYHTPRLYDAWEQSARANMQREIERLAS